MCVCLIILQIFVATDRNPFIVISKCIVPSENVSSSSLGHELVALWDSVVFCSAFSVSCFWIGISMELFGNLFWNMLEKKHMWCSLEEGLQTSYTKICAWTCSTPPTNEAAQINNTRTQLWTIPNRCFPRPNRESLKMSSSHIAI